MVRARGTIAGCSGSSLVGTHAIEPATQIRRSGAASGAENAFDARAASTARAFESVGTARSETLARRFCRSISEPRKKRKRPTHAASVHSGKTPRTAAEAGGAPLVDEVDFARCRRTSVLRSWHVVFPHANRYAFRCRLANDGNRKSVFRSAR